MVHSAFLPLKTCLTILASILLRHGIPSRTILLSPIWTGMASLTSYFRLLFRTLLLLVAQRRPYGRSGVMATAVSNPHRHSTLLRHLLGWPLVSSTEIHCQTSWLAIIRRTLSAFC